jgi:IS605 OrfB family transposase
MADQQRTYQGRLSLSSMEDEAFSTYASLFGKAERALFVEIRQDSNLTVLKREFLPKFGLTARQFNSISATVRGKTSSIKVRQKALIEGLQHRITKAEKVLKRITNPAKRHQKKRRVSILRDRLAIMKADLKEGKVSLCFGSRRLFRAQFHLEDNGYTCHEEWLRDWQSSRSSQFFVIGSKDETAGNQSCVATIAGDGSVSLKLRLPNAMSEYGKYLTFKGIRVDHRHEVIIESIGRNLSGEKGDGQAINYRFLKDDKGWRVFVTVDIPEVKRISRKDTGVIGIDINADHLAVTETDRFGNPVEYYPVPCITYGKTAEQRRAIIGDAVKQVIAFAVSRRKPLVIEELDFQKKKAVLEKQSKKFARMLSVFAYTQIQTIVRARAYDAGIEVCEVLPSYTTVIGQYKFKNRYGMSVHNAAALVIGRRELGFGEKAPSQLRGTLLRPEDRGRHVWSQWAIISRKDPAAHEAHWRSGLSRSSPSPPSSKQGTACDQSAWAGEPPACESSLELFE